MKENIVIIGGGLTGTSLFKFLSQAGRKVTLLEENIIGDGSTGHSRGMVRVYDPSPKLLGLAAEGLNFWKDLSEEHSAIFNNVGLAYFLNPENEQKAKEFINGNIAKSFAIELVAASEISKKCNLLNSKFLEEKRMAIWEPNAGYINPRLASRLFAEEGISLGSTVIEGAKVESIQYNKNKVEIKTELGAIISSCVIVANGSSLNDLISLGNTECRSIVLSSFSTNAEKTPNICLIDEISESFLRPAENGYYYIGGPDYSFAKTNHKLKIDSGNSKSQNDYSSSTLLEKHDASLVSIHKGYDLYTKNFLPIYQLPSSNSVGILSGFSGRGAKYIPIMAKQYTQELISKGFC